MAKSKNNRVLKYAKWCISESNKKVGTYVKAQAKEWVEI